MSIRNYTCTNCNHTELFFDHESKKCDKCNCIDFKKNIGVPLSNKITDKTDKYHNVNAEKGIQKDLKDRTKQHVQDTLDETIDEFGESIAKEQGWIIWDETQKKWRKRDNWDINLLHKTNKGSASTLMKQVKKK